MKVSISDTAHRDLEAVRRWIARDNPRRALSFLRELRERIDQLSVAFGRFPIVGGSDREPVHRMNYRRYRIFYQVSADRVDILHVHHAGRATPDFST